MLQDIAWFTVACSACGLLGFVLGILATVKTYMIMHENSIPPDYRPERKPMFYRKIAAIAALIVVLSLAAGCSNLAMTCQGTYTGDKVRNVKQ